MIDFVAKRAGVILSVSDVLASRDFYVKHFGLSVDAEYEDPAYVILVGAGMRLSLSQAGNEAADLPGYLQHPPVSPRSQATMLVFEVDDCDAAHETLRAVGVELASEVFRPPWGGGRFFALDLDSYLIEVEEMA
jgi:catechol 2,3-dioxygenase-like lactoylglutathione lyase family enzyme